MNAETVDVGLHQCLVEIGGCIKVEFGSCKNYEFAHTLAIELAFLVPIVKRNKSPETLQYGTQY